MNGHLHILSAFILGLGVSGHLVNRRELAEDRPGCNLDAFHAVGDRWYTTGHDGCLKYTCERRGVVSSQPCPRVAVPLGCTLVDGDQSAEYPRCCPRRECHPQHSTSPSEVSPGDSTSSSTTSSPNSSPSSSTDSSPSSSTDSSPISSPNSSPSSSTDSSPSSSTDSSPGLSSESSPATPQTIEATQL